MFFKFQLLKSYLKNHMKKESDEKIKFHYFNFHLVFDALERNSKVSRNIEEKLN